MKKEFYTTILKALEEHRLGDALYTLKDLSKQVNNWSAASRVEELSLSYDMMLQYMERGVKDDQRLDLYRQFLRKAYELADEIHVNSLKSAVDSELPAKIRELENLSEQIKNNRYDRNSSLYEQSTEKLQDERYKLSRNLFDILSDGILWDAEIQHAMTSFLNSPLVFTNDKALIASAVTLSLFKRFDVGKIDFLFTCYQLMDEELNIVRQRSFVGLVLVYLLHCKRMEEYPELTARLRLLSDEARFQKDLAGLQIQLLMTLETQNIQRRMQEEIIPSMMKNPKFRASKFGFDEMDFLSQNNDSNPEWGDENLQEIEKQIGQLSELQADGADIYMGTFSHLKSNSFFSHVANWFVPFEMGHPAVSKLFSAKQNPVIPSVLQQFLQSEALCDSDKYSFCLMALSIPTMQMDQMRQMLDQMQSPEGSGVHDFLQKKPFDSIAMRKHYLQDLYRYFKLCPHKQYVDDVFLRNLVLTDYPQLRMCFHDMRSIQDIANFAFKQKNYTLALSFYRFLEENKAVNSVVLQKMGACYQATKQYGLAIDVLEKVNLLKPNSKWVLTHLAQCYSAVGNYDKASVYYQMVELMDTEDQSVIYSLGKCLVHNGEYAEALKRFYKLDFLLPNNSKIQRAIAWCLILTRKPQQASVYYRRLLDKSPKSEDYLNAGHAMWMQGDVVEAVSCYVHAFTPDNVSNTTAIIEKMAEDKAELAYYGITMDDIRIMADLLAKQIWKN